MNVLGVIPARGNSKGLPRKNVLPILGKPVIAYTIEASLASEGMTRTVVSTDNAEIAEVARDYGAEVIIRPESMSTDSAPVEWALRHAVSSVEAKGFVPAVVVWMQANVPCRDQTAIDRVLDLLTKSGADSVATIYEVLPDFYALKRLEKDGRIVPLEGGQVKIFRRQDAPVFHLVDGAVVAIKRNVLMSSEGEEGLHVFMGDDVRGIVQDKRYALEIEEAFDLKLCEFIIRHLEAERSS